MGCPRRSRRSTSACRGLAALGRVVRHPVESAKRHDGRTAKLHAEAANHAAAQLPDFRAGIERSPADRGRRNSQFSKRGERVRREQKTEANLSQLRGAFVDLDVPAGALQRNACREPADSPADDERSSRHVSRSRSAGFARDARLAGTNAAAAANPRSPTMATTMAAGS